MRTIDAARVLLLSGLAIALTSVAVFFVAAHGGTPSTQPDRLELTYITDFGDDRRLVGAVNNVFVGRVMAQVGTTLLDEAPETQFQVEVLESIKGALSGRVVVNQEGGRDGDRLALVENDALLKPGQVYLFATRVYRERNWHTLVPGYGDIPIADARQQAALVARFKKATQEQIPYRPE